jgi:radical SAM protein with 4Fe4S-binding SPASM domain
MYKLNKSIEKVVLDGKSFLGNFDNGMLIPVTEKNMELFEKISKISCREEDLKDDMDFFNQLQEGGYFEEIIHPLSTAYLHVTNICNLNCKGCYSYDKTRNCKDKLSLQNIKYILEQFVENGVETLTISGGEPTIRKDITDIACYAKKIGVNNLNLITNGTIYDRNKMLCLKRYVDTFAVSIDGYSIDNPHFIRDEGTFTEVMDFINNAKQDGMPICILPTLHRDNIKYIDEYIKLSHNLNVPISFSLMTCSKELENLIPTNEELSFLADYLLKYMRSGSVPLQDYDGMQARKYCGAGKNIISVTAEGDVYPCHMMHGTNTKMGNILELPLNEILNNCIHFPSVDEIDGCKSCDVKNICGGGCKARVLLMNNTIDQPDTYCKMNKKYYKQYVTEYLNYG